MNFKPGPGKVMVREFEVEGFTQDEDRDYMSGIVEAVGDEEILDNGTVRPMFYRPLDQIFFDHGYGRTMIYFGIRYRITDQDNIQGKFI